MLEITDLTKVYGKSKVAVDNLSLTVNDGEIYGFIGHNGAGKTTTIKAVVGALDFSGEILINGKNIKKEPVKCKEIMAYIPDNPDIYEYLTGIQYLNFIGDIYKINSQDKMERIKYYSNIFEMEQNLGDLISSYSHGMKQKLVLISALIHNPKLLVLDEPFVGLDPKASYNLKQIMHDLCKGGASIFFSTHVLEVAEKLCDRVGIIKCGKLVKEGTIQEIAGDKSLESLFLEIENE